MVDSSHYYATLQRGIGQTPCSHEHYLVH